MNKFDELGSYVLNDISLSMTIGLATIFNKGKEDEGIVLVADKMVSMPPISVESNLSKIYEVKLVRGVPVYGVGSGATSLTSDFFDLLDDPESLSRFFPKDKIKDFKGQLANLKSVREVTELGLSVYNGMIADTIRRTLLDPSMLTIDDLKNSNLPPSVLNYLLTGIDKVMDDPTEGIRPFLFVLLAGIDRKGAHVHTIMNSRIYNPGTEGYGTVGSGSMSADWFLMHHEYDPDRDENYALLMALVAKFQAEESFGVGSRTDVKIIKRSGEKIISYDAPVGKVDIARNTYDKMVKADETMREDAITNMKKKIGGGK